MKKIAVIPFCTALVLSACLSGGCGKSEPAITQFSIVDALLCGMFDGCASISQVKSCGDLAVGTMNQLDGEMIMLDGKAYQVKFDGSVTVPSNSDTVAFATAVNFKPSNKVQLGAIKDLKNFEKMIPQYISNRNVPVAIRFKGSFSLMHTRAFERQNKPYRPLVDAGKNQAEFKFNNISGDMVGFMFPKYARGTNVPGWNLYFVDKDRRCGGHVLNFSMLNGTLEICEVYDFRTICPNETMLSHLDLSKDRERELKKANSSRK